VPDSSDFITVIPFQALLGLNGGNRDEKLAVLGGSFGDKKTAQAGEEAPTWTVSRKGETRVEGPDARDDAQPKRRTRSTGDEVSQSSATSSYLR